MSDTPRTDAAEQNTSESIAENWMVVSAGFARTLERELAEAQAGIECAQQVEQVLRERIAELEEKLYMANEKAASYLHASGVGRLERELAAAAERIAELGRALPPPEKLRTLAHWFDTHDAHRSVIMEDNEVQLNLRRWADAIDAARAKKRE